MSGVTRNRSMRERQRGEEFEMNTEKKEIESMRKGGGGEIEIDR